MKSSNHVLNKIAQAILLIILTFTFGCQQQTAPEQSEKENNKLLQRYIELVNTGNLSIADEICTPDVIRYTNGKKNSNVGIEAFKKNIEGHRTRYPDVNIKSDEVITKNDKVVCRYTYTATQTGPGNYPPTGRKVTIYGVIIITIVDGKIAETWLYWNNEDWNKQLGYTITPPSTTNTE